MNHEKLIDQLSEQLSASPRLPTSRSLCYRFAGLSFFLSLVVLGIHGLRPDYALALLRFGFWFEFVLVAGTAVFAAGLTLSSAIPGRIVSIRSYLGFLALIAGAWFLALMRHPWQGLAEGAGSVWGGIGCGVTILVVAALPGYWLMHQVRRRAPTRLKVHGVLGMLAATAIAAANQQFMCPMEDALHLVLWHAWPLLLTAGLGFALARRLYSW